MRRKQQDKYNIFGGVLLGASLFFHPSYFPLFPMRDFSLSSYTEANLRTLRM